VQRPLAQVTLDAVPVGYVLADADRGQPDHPDDHRYEETPPGPHQPRRTSRPAVSCFVSAPKPSSSPSASNCACRAHVTRLGAKRSPAASIAARSVGSSASASCRNVRMPAALSAAAIFGPMPSMRFKSSPAADDPASEASGDASTDDTSASGAADAEPDPKPDS